MRGSARRNTRETTRFCNTAEKIFSSSFRVCTRREPGQIETTSDCMSASIMQQIGPTTLVLPAPMIICCTQNERGPPSRRAATNLRIVAICADRSKKPVTDSKIKKRGSYLNEAGDDVDWVDAVDSPRLGSSAASEATVDSSTAYARALASELASAFARR